MENDVNQIFADEEKQAYFRGRAVAALNEVRSIIDPVLFTNPSFQKVFINNYMEVVDKSWLPYPKVVVSDDGKKISIVSGLYDRRDNNLPTGYRYVTSDIELIENSGIVSRLRDLYLTDRANCPNRNYLGSSIQQIQYSYDWYDKNGISSDRSYYLIEEEVDTSLFRHFNPNVNYFQDQVDKNNPNLDRNTIISREEIRRDCLEASFMHQTRDDSALGTILVRNVVSKNGVVLDEKRRFMTNPNVLDNTSVKPETAIPYRGMISDETLLENEKAYYKGLLELRDNYPEYVQTHIEQYNILLERAKKNLIDMGINPDEMFSGIRL